MPLRTVKVLLRKRKGKDKGKGKFRTITGHEGTE
jgi:hypothetical protein